MRMTLLKGVEDGVDIDLGGDVGVICAVMKIGKRLDELVCEADLTGEEVLKLLEECGYRYIDEVRGDIVKEHHYTMTAFDY